jgi:hypothetical protein
MSPLPLLADAAATSERRSAISDKKNREQPATNNGQQTAEN